ncbi:MAG: L,D-transpeptidase family protein [Acidimicrobiia bacterium]
MRAGAKHFGRWATGTGARIAMVLVVLVVTACSGPVEVDTEARGQVDDEAPGSEPPAPPPTSATTTTTTAPPPPTTQPPAPVPAVGAVPPQGLGPGARSPQVKVLEDLLAAQKYGVHTIDDAYDQNTADAVVAFQKAAGLPRTGRATQDVADALTTSHPPDPLVPGGGATRVEIDLPRQILLLYQNDALLRVLPVSTGSGKRFCDRGRCRTAATPPGSFRVGYRIPGWRKSPLGRMYKPVYYMVGIGVAIHGYHQVPTEPASHGCVRIPMASADWFSDQVPDGTPVYVLDGRTPPGPPPPEGTQT